MTDLIKGGDLAMAARLKAASGLATEQPKVKKIKVPQMRKHPYAYIYIDKRGIPEGEQKKKLIGIIDAFKQGPDSDIRNLFDDHTFVTVTLPKNTFVCAVRVDAKLFQASRLAKYLRSQRNKHNLSVYLRKPRKDVQAKIST